jgi:hypothetical protein
MKPRRFGTGLPSRCYPRTWWSVHWFSGNHEAAAVAFDELPAFLMRTLEMGGKLRSTEGAGRVVMMLSREQDGTWRDIAGGETSRLYRIESVN